MEQLDQTLPHGRLWVAERGCRCPECAAAVERHQLARVAEARVVTGVGRRRLAAGARWSRPRWTKWRGRWVITEPPGQPLTPGRTVMVVSHGVNRTTEVMVAALAGEKQVERDVWLRVFYPAR